jgi:hypothetical protein
MEEQRGPAPDMVFWGLVLVALGVVFSLDEINVLKVEGLWRYWPLILIVMGISKILTPGERGRRGIWLLLIGSWALVGTFGLFGLGWGSSWPLLLVAVGLSIVWQAIFERPDTAPQREDSHVG